MKRDLIAILAFGLAAALSIVTDVLPIWAKLVLCAVFLLMTAAAICVASPSRRAWLENSLAPESRWTLYHALVEPMALRWPRDWRLYDVAWRIAVLYAYFPAAGL